MQPAEPVPTNGRPPSRAEEAAAHFELGRLRAICSRQAAAIEHLTEDVAMFRRAVIALGIGDADPPHRPRARHDRPGADQDELTGALTRGNGMRGIEHEIARAKRTGDPLTLAFVDVDGLRAVNDTQGRAVGDTLLRNVVTALRAGLREADLIVRYGGGGFLCVLPGAAADDAAARLELSEGVLAVFATGSLSVGLTEFRPGDDAAALVARAERALYEERDQPLEVR